MLNPASSDLFYRIRLEITSFTGSSAFCQAQCAFVFKFMLIFKFTVLPLATKAAREISTNSYWIVFTATTLPATAFRYPSIRSHADPGLISN